MADIREIVLKKTELAIYKGLGKNNTEMAEKFGVKPGEINEALVIFGMKKGNATKKEYQIKYVDDMDTADVNVEEKEVEKQES